MSGKGLASLKAGQQVIPVTLDAIREPLASSLVGLSVLAKCLTVRHFDYDLLTWLSFSASKRDARTAITLLRLRRGKR